MQQIASYLAENIIGDNPTPSLMIHYAEQLHDFGFNSIELIQARMRRDYIDSFDWMQPLHKVIFKEKLEE